MPTIALVGPVGLLLIAKFGTDAFDYDLEADGAWLLVTTVLLGLL